MADIKLLPYVHLNGEWTLSDNVLHGFFEQLIEDGTAGVVFADGYIVSSDQFIQFMQQTKNLPVFAFMDNVIVGLAWLNAITGKHAFAHFVMLKEIWGKHTDEVGTEIIKYWFMLPNAKGGPMFEVLLGLLPSVNERAQAFIKRLGFKEVGRIPKMLFDADKQTFISATLLYIER